MKKNSIFSSHLFFSALKDTFVRLSPHIQFKNPVMFVTYLGAIIVSIYVYQESINNTFNPFHLQICLWLWFTILFANFASALAESRGKAQADSLRQKQKENEAKRVVKNKVELISSSLLKKGDIVICEPGDIVPADGEVIEGIATVDESAITGESAPVIRESGGDRSAVTAGTKVVSDKITVKVTSEKGNTFLDRMISLIEGSQRQKTPNEIALNIFLSSLTIIFLFTVISIKIFADYTFTQSGSTELKHLVNIPILIALFVCIIPTTISSLLSAIGIAGMDRLVQKNVIAKSGRAVEAAGDIDVLILDKTGTITLGSRLATDFFPSKDVDPKSFAEIAQLASLSDETPEGRSIVVLAKNAYGLRGEDLDKKSSKFIPFSAQTRMSGIDFYDENGKVIRFIRKGAVDAVESHSQKWGMDALDPGLLNKANEIASKGATPLLVSDNGKIVGIIQLKDIIKGGIKERFAQLRKVGIRTLMITGDNPLTAGAIAAEAGVDDFVAQATPEDKLLRIRNEQKEGHLIAMTGDGTNDAPALAQSDVGVAMNTGTQASHEAGNMIDLDNNPTKLLEIVEIGKQLLITRGALTTFSIANDLAKYFAIIPAIFGQIYAHADTVGPLENLNIMRLHSPESAILSAVIFNAIIIPLLIPLSLRGVKYKPLPAKIILRNHLLIYGLGGIITPFICIKIIDMLISIVKWNH